MFRKKNTLTVSDMLRIEEWLEQNFIPIVGMDLEDNKVSEKLRLKVEYVSPKELPPHVEAELCPIESLEYLGLIRVSNNYYDSSFPYLHEIMHYIMDVGIGNKVREVFTRKSKGHTDSKHEQEVNYATAAAIIPYTYVESKIKEYDKSSPKMDEIELVDSISRKYNQPRNAVIRRIQEVRRMQKVKKR